MSDISKSAIENTPELEAQLKSAGNVEQMKELLRAAAISQSLVVPDAFDNRILLPVEQQATPAPQKFATSITVNGQKHILESDTELGLAEAEKTLYRELLSPAQTTYTVEPVAQPRRNNRGQYVSTDDAAAKADLELRFKRGDIDAATYLSESGAVDSYLESQGISLTDVKKVSQQNYAADWKTATDAFLEHHPEWEGGTLNLQEAARTLKRLDLLGAPTVESIEAAYQDMRQRNAVAKNPELEKQRELHSRFANATSFSEIQEAAASSLFGRR